MNKLICPMPVTVEVVAYRWMKKQMKMQKLKSKIADCVKNNHMESAKKYAAELKEVEESPLVNLSIPYICY